jgi:uncharacterized protein YqgQ
MSKSTTKLSKDEHKLKLLNELKSLGYTYYTEDELNDFAEMQQFHVQVSSIYAHMLGNDRTAHLLCRLIVSQRAFGLHFFQTLHQLHLATGIKEDCLKDHIKKLKSLEYIKSERGGPKNRNYYVIDLKKVTKDAMAWILNHPMEVNELSHIFGLIEKEDFAKRKKKLQKMVKTWGEKPTTKNNQWGEIPTTEWGEKPTTHIRESNKENRSSTNVEEGEVGTSPPTLTPQKKVFQYWQTKMNHPKARFDETRNKQITKAFKLGFTQEQCCMAIDGCFLDPYARGDNKDGAVLDKISFIFNRGAEVIESFIAIAEGTNHKVAVPIRNKNNLPKTASEVRQQKRRVSKGTLNTIVSGIQLQNYNPPLLDKD